MAQTLITPHSIGFPLGTDPFFHGYPVINITVLSQDNSGGTTLCKFLHDHEDYRTTSFIEPITYEDRTEMVTKFKSRTYDKYGSSFDIMLSSFSNKMKKMIPSFTTGVPPDVKVVWRHISEDDLRKDIVSPLKPNLKPVLEGCNVLIIMFDYNKLGQIKQEFRSTVTRLLENKSISQKCYILVNKIVAIHDISEYLPESWCKRVESCHAISLHETIQVGSNSKFPQFMVKMFDKIKQEWPTMLKFNTVYPTEFIGTHFKVGAKMDQTMNELMMTFPDKVAILCRIIGSNPLQLTEIKTDTTSIKPKAIEFINGVLVNGTKADISTEQKIIDEDYVKVPTPKGSVTVEDEPVAIAPKPKVELPVGTVLMEVNKYEEKKEEMVIEPDLENMTITWPSSAKPAASPVPDPRLIELEKFFQTLKQQKIEDVMPVKVASALEDWLNRLANIGSATPVPNTSTSEVMYSIVDLFCSYDSLITDEKKLVSLYFEDKIQVAAMVRCLKRAHAYFFLEQVEEKTNILDKMLAIVLLKLKLTSKYRESGSSDIKLKMFTYIDRMKFGPIGAHHYNSVLSKMRILASSIKYDMDAQGYKPSEVDKLIESISVDLDQSSPLMLVDKFVVKEAVAYKK